MTRAKSKFLGKLRYHITMGNIASLVVHNDEEDFFTAIEVQLFFPRKAHNAMNKSKRLTSITHLAPLSGKAYEMFQCVRTLYILIKNINNENHIKTATPPMMMGVLIRTQGEPIMVCHCLPLDDDVLSVRLIV